MGEQQNQAVEVLGPDRLADVVGVLCDSFRDYPVMRFVLGSDEDYAARLERMIGVFALSRVLRKEVVMGIERAETLAGTALVSFPGRVSNPPELNAVRDRMWTELGDPVRTRYEAFSAATAPLAPTTPHIHLNMLGVRRSAQGLGLGRMLLDAVHELSAADPLSSGVSLTTELPANVPLYQHFGYEVIGSASVEDAFTTWTMYRPDTPA